MQERDYPTYASSPRDRPPIGHYSDDPDQILTKEALAERLSEIDEAHAADIQTAIKEAAEMRADVHLYRKRGSQFLGIGFQPATGASVKVYEYPEITS